MTKSDEASHPSDKLLRSFITAADEDSNVSRQFVSAVRCIDEARELHERSRTWRKAMMRLHGIETETEVLTGCVSQSFEIELLTQGRHEIVGDSLFAIRTKF